MPECSAFPLRKQPNCENCREGSTRYVFDLHWTVGSPGSRGRSNDELHRPERKYATEPVERHRERECAAGGARDQVHGNDRLVQYAERQVWGRTATGRQRKPTGYHWRAAASTSPEQTTAVTAARSTSTSRTCSPGLRRRTSPGRVHGRVVRDPDVADQHLERRRQQRRGPVAIYQHHPLSDWPLRLLRIVRGSLAQRRAGMVIEQPQVCSVAKPRAIRLGNPDIYRCHHERWRSDHTATATRSASAARWRSSST